MQDKPLFTKVLSHACWDTSPAESARRVSRGGGYYGMQLLYSSGIAAAAVVAAIIVVAVPVFWQHGGR